MPYAKLTIDLPEAVWTGEVARECPSATFRVLSAVSSGDAGFGLLEIESESIPTVLDTIEGRAGISTANRSCCCRFRSWAHRSNPPLTIRDGEAVIEPTASRDRLSEFGWQLAAFGMSYTLNRVYDAVETPTLLTDQQRRLLVTAVELGYYDTPREWTLTELTEEVALAKSTASVTLHRAEETVVKEFAAERLDVTLDEQPQAV